MADTLVDNFIVRSLTTELHRVGWSRNDASAWILVNLGDDIRFNLRALRSELSAWPDRDQGTAYFDVGIAAQPGAFEYLSKDGRSYPVLFRHSELVQAAFEDAARQAGFRQAHAKVYGYEAPSDWRHEWSAVVADLQSHRDHDATIEEPAYADDVVAAFPVRTAISRFETHSADCVLRVIPLLNEMTPEAAARILPSAEAQLSRLPLAPRRRLFLLHDCTTVNDQVRDTLRTILDTTFWKGHLGFEVSDGSYDVGQALGA